MQFSSDWKNRNLIESKNRTFYLGFFLIDACICCWHTQLSQCLKNQKNVSFYAQILRVKRATFIWILTPKISFVGCKSENFFSNFQTVKKHQKCRNYFIFRPGYAEFTHLFLDLEQLTHFKQRQKTTWIYGWMPWTAKNQCTSTLPNHPTLTKHSSMNPVSTSSHVVFPPWKIAD